MARRRPGADSPWTGRTSSPKGRQASADSPCYSQRCLHSGGFVRRIAVSLLMAAAVSAVPGAQQEQAPPAARAADLLTLGAAVMDGEGRPVRDLKPADFAVTIDGKPRKVLVARF